MILLASRDIFSVEIHYIRNCGARLWWGSYDVFDYEIEVATLGLFNLTFGLLDDNKVDFTL